MRAMISTGQTDPAALVARARTLPSWPAWIWPRRSPSRSPTAGWTASPKSSIPAAPPWMNASGANGRAKSRWWPWISASNTTSCAPLAARGMEIVVVPAFTEAETIQRMAPDGVFLSNGPGDPEPVTYGIRHHSRAAGLSAHLRHLPGAPAARPGPRRQDLQTEVRPPGRQPAGQGPDHRERRDHLPESRLCRGCNRSTRRRSRSPTSI